MWVEFIYKSFKRVIYFPIVLQKVGNLEFLERGESQERGGWTRKGGGDMDPLTNYAKYELTDICILYTDPQLITVVITLLRTTTAKKNFLYYPLMGLHFWPWSFHQEGQGFHLVREVREFVRGSGKVREIWNFLEKVWESQGRKFLSMQSSNF